ncbi:tape measure protein [uncultured Bacteroides sp.]|uniref:tape measure protein n=1 Tax=uncultured Bacteroides sp. TaxID=162156 RepID=UPI0025AE20C3|nr:tape measure protein [uncultured Bacteroides sp.]
MDTQGTIGIKATLDISEMQKNVQKYVQNIDMMQDHTDTASQSVARSFSRMQAAGAAFLSMDLAKRISSEIVSVYGTFQQLGIAFKTMLQDGEKANKLMGELINFAAITPFNLIDVGKGAKQLLAYGTKVESIKTELEMLGNVASGVSVPLGDLIYLYGTLRSQGRAYAVDIRQFAGRGIPIYAELAKVLNVNVSEVNKLVEAGRVGFPEVEKAFQNMTNKGGMFFNLMEEQSKSVTGKISNLKDKLDVMFNDIGQGNDGLINGAIDGASSLVDHYKEIGTALGALIALYGIHKTALIANAAFYDSLHSAENVARINAETEALKQLCAEEEIATAIKSDLKEGSEDFLEALKEEIDIEKERQSQLVTKSGLELKDAKSRLEAAEAAKAKALEEIQLRKEELATAISTAQAEKAASLDKQMTLEREKQSRAALLITKLEERKLAEIASVEEMKYQRWLLASSGKETAVIDKKIAAKQREIATISEKIAAAKAEEIQHSRNIVALRAEQKAIDETITSKDIDKAQTRLNTAEQKLNTASKNANVAANEVSTQSIALESASKKVNSLETGVNTAGVTANNTAKTFGARVTGLLTAATAKLNAVLANNIWTIVAIGIAAVCYGIYKLITYQTDAEKAQKKLNDRIREFNSETDAEQAEIDRLFGKLDAAKKGTDEYNKAKQAIIDKYGEYLKGLGDEKTALDDVALAYQAVSAAAKQAALDRAIADSSTTAQKDWAENQGKLVDQLEKAVRNSDKYSGKKGIDREVSAVVQMIKNDLKAAGKLSEETQKLVDGLTVKTYSSSPVMGEKGEWTVSNDVQVYVERMKRNNAVLEKTYKDIHDKLGYDTNQYINLTAKQISNDIAMYEAALERFKKTGKNQVVKVHDGSVSNQMGEAEMRNHLRKLKEAQEQQRKDEEKAAKSKIAPDITKEVEEATAKVSKLKQEIEDLRNGKTKVEAGKTIKSVIEEKAKELKEAESALATLTGDDKQTVNSKKKKQEEANRLKVEQAERQRQIDEMNQQDKERAIQAELEFSQAKIDTLDEGFKKQQEQIALNYRKAKADNARRVAQYIKDQQDTERKEWEKKHPKYKEEGLVFIPKTKTKEDLSPEKKKTLDDYDKAAIEAREKADAVLSKNLLEQYQDYTDQRLAIEKKFNDDIAALRIQREKFQKEGNTDKVQQTDRSIAQATKMKGESLVNFDYEQLKKSPDYVRAFENLKQTSTETLSSLLEQLESAKESAARVLSPDQLREYTSTIQSIMDELEERNPFQMLADRKRELAEAEEELAKAKKELEAVKGGAQIVTGVKNTKYNASTGKIESEKTYLTAAEAAAKYNKAQDKVIKKSAQVTSAEKKVTESFDKLFSAIQDVGSSIGGLTGEIIGMIGSIGSTVMTSIEGLSAASKASSAAIQTVEKASVILAIISAAIQLATKVASFFAADYSEYNKAKEAYESYVKVLDTVIEKQKELMQTMTGENAKNAYKYALELIDKQAAAARELGKDRLNAGASAGSHSIGVRIKKGMSDEGWRQAQNAIGSSAYNQIKDGRMEGLFDLSVEQLEKLRNEAPIFWAKLDDDVKDYLESIIESGEKIEEMNEAWKESLTGVSFDSVYDSFLDMLYDMDSDSKDFAQSFGDYFRKAMIKAMFDKNYKAKLEEWYDLWAEYMDDGVIDDDEQRSLDNLKDSIISGAKAGADLINDQFKELYEDEDSREGSQKGIANASQDSVDELNGRMTMTNVLLSDVKAELQSHTLIYKGVASGIVDIKSITMTMNENIRIIKDNMSVIVGHLSNIDTNTARLEGISKDIGLMKDGIQKMNDKGVKMTR